MHSGLSAYILKQITQNSSVFQSIIWPVRKRSHLLFSLSVLMQPRVIFLATTSHCYFKLSLLWTKSPTLSILPPITPTQSKHPHISHLLRYRYSPPPPSSSVSIFLYKVPWCKLFHHLIHVFLPLLGKFPNNFPFWFVALTWLFLLPSLATFLWTNQISPSD